MVPENSPGISRVPGYSGAALIHMPVSPTGFSPSTTELSSSFGYQHINRYWRSYYPAPALPQQRFGLCRVRSRFACRWLEATWVAPFGYLRVTVHVPLAAAFRSLSRPSSPPRAKASAVCSYLLFFYLFARALNFLYLLPVCQCTRVENNGFEPLTPCVQGRCSSQLS